MMDKEGKEEAGMHQALTLCYIRDFRSQTEVRERGPLVQRAQTFSDMKEDAALKLTKSELKPKAVLREWDTWV